MKLITFIAAAATAMSVSAQTDSIEFANTIKIPDGATREQLAAYAAHVLPTPAQVNALDDGYIAFIHIGPNTFSRREWGTGFEDPADFKLETLDTDQWVKAMKEAGMKKVIITAKHHDGFVIWQSRYTDHGIMNSPFKGGKGDIVRELSESCKKYGMKLGIYLSPADLYQIENANGLYGNLSPKTTRTIPRKVEGRPFANETTFTFDGIDDYNEYFLNQLFELLTEYGPIHEVWFDGAHPKHKGGQTYNYSAWKKLIRTLAPDAVIFGREDIRWCGNEGGRTRPIERNVISFPSNPDTASTFGDRTKLDLGSLDALSEGKYLHYQPAEIDTSIREGWFYRDEDTQRSRSADDIFDIYERGVGGNAIFLLNIPPNREGRFSQRDVDALTEAGKRIRETYSGNLLAGADMPEELMDGDIETYIDADEPVEIVLNHPVTINRVMLREPVSSRSERIDSLAVDAWVGGKWVNVASTAYVGFRRILRFNDVTTDRLRVRVIGSRLAPYLAAISAHFYKARPSRIAATRSLDGKVTLAPATDGFRWNRSNTAPVFPEGTQVRYTTDGSEPTASSALYTAPFTMADGVMKARAFLNGESGPVLDTRFGHIKKGWKVIGATSSADGHSPQAAIDANPSTYWSSDNEADAAIAIDLGAPVAINGVIYTPQTSNGQGMIAKGRIEVSDNGRDWREAGVWDLGNLINDPTPREYRLPKAVNARYIRVTSVETAGNSPVASIAEFDIF
ncbi:MAG: alpha-L-fucosidase [Candidatus Amulumruptor sp.]|nr:alpha-L-fucosidase [Candidatus Amulumruptor sp.]